MTAPLTDPTLSPQDLYVLARALVGLDAQDLPCSPMTRLVLAHLDVTQPEGIQMLRQLLGPDVLGERKSNRPVVRAAHWYRAQEVAELWRASAHRLLHDLGDSEESRLEMRILKLLVANPRGLSVRECTARCAHRANQSSRRSRH
jgi:hypothetical protein